MPEKDLPYAHTLYHRILDQVTVNGSPVGGVLLEGKYNLWDVFRQSALFDDCVSFSVEKTWVSVKDKYRPERYDARSFKEAFIGFSLFLWSCGGLIRLWLSRVPVLIFSVDKESAKKYHADFRIEGLYEVLRGRNVVFTELFHTLVGKKALGRALRRGRAALYLEAIDGLYYSLRALRRIVTPRVPEPKIGGLESFSEDERRLIEALVMRYVRLAPLVSFRMDFLRFALRNSGVKVILGIDDARFYHELAGAAQALSILFYAFQHGANFNPYFVAWQKDARLQGKVLKPNYLVVWNEYWKNELLNMPGLWSADELIVGGVPRVFSPKIHFHRGRSILIPYETETPHHIVEAFVRTLHEKGYRILYKIRPDVDTHEQLNALGAAKEYVQAVTETPKEVGAVIGAYSTYLYDAIAAGIPTGLLTTPLSYATRLVKNGLAEPVDPQEPEIGIARLFALSEGELQRRGDALAPEADFKEA